MPLDIGGGIMPDTDPNSKESARGREELLQMEVGLFFTSGEIMLPITSCEVVLLKMVVIDGGVGLFFTGWEMTMSNNGREVASLMMVDVGDKSVSLLVVLLDGLEVPLVVMIDGGCMEGEMSFISIEPMV